MKLVGGLLLAYGAASLIHFGHNAAFADAYPNLPQGLTPAVVMSVWGAEALIGLLGWIALRRGHVSGGLAALAGYAALGFDGLGHYALAPVSAHTRAMNLSIALEVAAAALLLVVVGGELSGRLRSRSEA